MSWLEDSDMPIQSVYEPIHGSYPDKIKKSRKKIDLDKHCPDCGKQIENMKRVCADCEEIRFQDRQRRYHKKKYEHRIS